jgi:hypothetical protein
MKISHESPLSLLETSRNYNDYDYALVHLFEDNPIYYNFFKESLEMGRHVLLDNSIFELGEAFDSDKYAFWIEKLKPTEYIIPDVLFDADKTIDNAIRWMEKYKDLPSKKIGVIQGNNYSDLVKCYEWFDKELNLDKIAIPFVSDYYRSACKHPNEWVSLSHGRVEFISQMLYNDVINKSKPHHLLGCTLPSEFMYYRGDEFNWIETMDTSNPIVHGLLNIKYEDYGLLNKESVKLVELLDAKPTEEQLDIIMHNIKIFRNLVNGQ